MRYYLLIKLLPAFLMSIIIVMNLNGQTNKQMIVPYHSQETDNWCYAASIKMILDFHSNSTDPRTQCDVARNYYKYRNPSKYDSDDVETEPCCLDCATVADCISNTSITIKFSKEGGNGKPQPDYFDLVFDDLGFHSRQVISKTSEPLSWKKIKNEIDNCRPFIITIDARPTDESDLDANHVLVVKGYRDDEDPGNLGVFVSDPWEPCQTGTANEAFFPIEVFEREATPNAAIPPAAGDGVYVNRVLSIVHSIYPYNILETHDNCLSCDTLETVYGLEAFIDEEVEVDSDIGTLRLETPENDDPTLKSENDQDLLHTLVENASRVAGYPKYVINEAEYDSLRDDNNHLYAPIKYIEEDKLNPPGFFSCLFPPRKLEKIIDNEGYEVTDVVSVSVDPDLVSTFQKDVTGKWHLRGIFTYTNLESDMVVRLDGTQRTFTLTNKENPEGIENSRDFVLIRNRPEQYEFFSFKPNPNNATNYLAPGADYPELDLFKGIAYEESEVIKTLQKDLELKEKLLKEFLDSKVKGGKNSSLSPKEIENQ